MTSPMWRRHEEVKRIDRRLRRLRREAFLSSPYMLHTWWGNLACTFVIWAIVMAGLWTFSWALASLLSWDWKPYPYWSAPETVKLIFAFVGGTTWMDIWGTHYQAPVEDEPADIFD